MKEIIYKLLEEASGIRNGDKLCAKHELIIWIQQAERWMRGKVLNWCFLMVSTMAEALWGLMKIVGHLGHLV